MMLAALFLAATIPPPFVLSEVEAHAPNAAPATRPSTALRTNGARADLSKAFDTAIARCRSTAPTNEITVCAHQPGDADRYRLPLRDEDDGFDPLGPVDSVSRERQRLIDGDGASTDLTRGSCSSVGASGWTGCQIKTWREHDQQKGW